MKSRALIIFESMCYLIDYPELDERKSYRINPDNELYFYAGEFEGKNAWLKEYFY